MAQLTRRINAKSEVLAEEDWGVTDYKRRKLGLRRLKVTFEHVPDPAGTYKSYEPGKYVMLIGETLRNGATLEESRPRVFLECQEYQLDHYLPKFELRCKQTRERALAKGGR